MLKRKTFENGFQYLEVKNSAASAKIALQGAHIFEYKRKAQGELFYLSETSDFALGKAIRGGVPICWPSFGLNNPDLPQHGFARVFLFEYISSSEMNATTTQLVFGLNDSAKTLSLWNYKFELRFIVTISDTLTMELQTLNKDTKEFTLTQAFHSYFKVSDISNIVLSGLDTKPCFDTLTKKNTLQNGDITVSEEFDKVFQEVDTILTLQDKDKIITIQNEGSSSVVVWNPWVEKCKRMNAMQDDDYREFICIESANAFEDFVVVKPNETQILKTIIL